MGHFLKFQISENGPPSGQTTTPAGNQKLSKITSGYGGLMIPLGRIRLETLPFWCPVMMVTKNMETAEKNGFWPKNCFFDLKISSFLRYAHITPLFRL